MLVLNGQTKTVSVEAEDGLSLLDLAIKHEVDWKFSCTRGTCARCRCLVETGGEYLEEITDAEWNRMEEHEFEEGFRLACQAIVKENAGEIVVRNVPYF